MSSNARDQKGVELAPISVTEFKDFASKHATSEEVGRIATCLDGDTPQTQNGQVELLGLLGCGRICGVISNLLVKSRTGDSYACKLDSVVVDSGLRNRGLASLLAAEAFARILANAERSISSFYAHSVHPATVKLLRGLTFSDPGPVGAPISSYPVDEEARQQLQRLCDEHRRGISSRLRLQCALCKARDRRAVPWCQPRKG